MTHNKSHQPLPKQWQGFGTVSPAEGGIAVVLEMKQEGMSHVVVAEWQEIWQAQPGIVLGAGDGVPWDHADYDINRLPLQLIHSASHRRMHRCKVHPHRADAWNAA